MIPLPSIRQGAKLRFARLRGGLACALAIIACLVAGAGPVAAGAGPPLRLYIDVDRTHTATVGRKIELGVRTALAVTGWSDRIAVIARDHRGNARRSFDTITDAADDARAIAVIGGMHSPPYLIFGERINDLRIPLVLPWSAGAAITRQAETPSNWMFRVSVDDHVADVFLAQRAVELGCRLPGIVVLDNPWGNANASGMQRALAGLAVVPRGVRQVPIGARAAQVERAVEQLVEVGAQCILTVADPVITAVVIEYLAARSVVLPVISHWGVLGSQETLDALRVPLARVPLAVLGTCGLERLGRDPSLVARAELAASGLMAGRVKLEDLHAPHAFFQAYDATRLLVEAIALAAQEPDWAQGPAARRDAVRRALYRIDGPVDGFLKTYERPFSPVTASDRDGHDALGAHDLCLSRLDAVGRLRPLDISAITGGAE